MSVRAKKLLKTVSCVLVIGIMILVPIELFIVLESSSSLNDNEPKPTSNLVNQNLIKEEPNDYQYFLEDVEK